LKNQESDGVAENGEAFFSVDWLLAHAPLLECVGGSLTISQYNNTRSKLRYERYARLGWKRQLELTILF
jgi:hypothetical protein